MILIKNIGRGLTFIRKRKKSIAKWAMCLFHALVLLVVTYLLWNKSYSWGDENAMLRKLHTLQEILDILPPANKDSVVLINISYDKVLTDIYDDQGMRLGQVDITDRDKLYRLFDILKNDDTYQYILCDISLNSVYQSESDSLLQACINKMSRIRFPYTVDDDGIPHSTLAGDKASYSGYTKTFLMDDFFKYQFVHNGNRSLALDMWMDINSGHMEHTGLLWKQNGRLAVNSIILSFPFVVTSFYDSNGNQLIYNLGEDILGMHTEEEIVRMCRGKLILIGSFFEQDIHTTVAGNMPGILINYNAYLALSAGKLKIPLGIFILLFVVYFVLTAAIIFDKSLINALPQKIFKIDKHYFEIIFTWFGYGVLMMVLCLFCYLIAGVYLDILIIASWFTLLQTGIKFARLIRNSNHKTKNI